MKVLIVEQPVKSIAPNIALMKLSTYCETKGYPYKYVHGMVKPNLNPDVIYTSCIFSYYSETYKKVFKYYKRLFPNVPILAGGPVPTIIPDWFKLQGVTPYLGLATNFEQCIPKFNVNIEGNLPYIRNKIVLYSSKGCVNSCKFCVVPKLEGSMKSYKSIYKTLETAKEELPEAESIVLYDNNFTEHEYFDTIIDELKDFNMPIDIFGLHCESFTAHHAKRLAELKWAGQGNNSTPYVRFAFDRLKYATHVEAAFRLVKQYKVPAQFFCYLLYGFNDSPKDCWKRIELAQEIRDRVGTGIIYLFPQRYQPLDSLKRNTYVAKNWTPELLLGFSRLYTQIRNFISITESRSVYDWIGHSYSEFLERCTYMASHTSISKTNL